MSVLNKAELLSIVNTANKPELREIDGIGQVYLKKLSVAEQNELVKKADDNVTASLSMVAYSLCDENGKRLFADSDIKELGKMNAVHLTAIADVISELNGFDKTADDIKKN